MKNLIIGNQLEKARALLGLTIEAAARELSLGPDELASWEKGQVQPKLNQLTRLAEFYGRALDYFLKPTPEPPSQIKFRGKKGYSFQSLSHESKMVFARFDELCRISLELEEMTGKPLKVLIPKMMTGHDPKSAAAQMRSVLSVSQKPLLNLRNLLEHKGIRIFELPVPGEDFSGFSLWHSQYGPCILVNAGDPKSRRNFTLAHELAHLIFNHGSSVCYIPIAAPKETRGEEYLANKFAENFLMPESPLRKDFAERGLSRNPTEPSLRMLATKWGVSIQALGYRLEHLGMVDEGITNRLVEEKPKHIRGPKGPRWQRQLGKHFVDISFQAYQNGLITSGKLAQSLGLPLRKVIEAIEKPPLQ